MLVTTPARNPPAHPISRINDWIDIPHSDMTECGAAIRVPLPVETPPWQRARSCETPL
jgi:hypothetical protein